MEHASKLEGVTPGKKESGFSKFIKSKIARIAIAGITIAGVGGTVAYEVSKSSEPTPIVSTFDVSAMKSTIDSNNSVQIPIDEYFETAPPIWNEESKTMTFPIPVLFRDNRIPTLSIEKLASQFSGRINRISIDGFEQGDVFYAPYEGNILVNSSAEDTLTFFFLKTTDSQGKEVSILFQLPPLEPLISFDQPISENGTLIPVEEKQPIGKILASDKDLSHKYQIELSGGGPLIENFNLDTTPEGKAIILK